MNPEQEQTKRKLYKEAVVEYVEAEHLPPDTIRTSMEQYDTAVYVNSENNPITRVLNNRLAQNT